jgi:hypothetical protein
VGDAPGAREPSRQNLAAFVALPDAAALALLICASGVLTGRAAELWSHVTSILRHFLLHATAGAATVGGVILLFATPPGHQRGIGPRAAAVALAGWAPLGAWVFLAMDWYISSERRWEALALGPGAVAVAWLVRAAAIWFVDSRTPSLREE